MAQPNLLLVPLVTGVMGLMTGIVVTAITLLAGFRSSTMTAILQLGEAQSRRIVELEREMKDNDERCNAKIARLDKDNEKLQTQIVLLKTVLEEQSLAHDQSVRRRLQS